MSKWGRQWATAIAIELVCDRHCFLCSSSNGASDQCVNVFDVKQDGHRGSPERLGAAIPHIRELIRKHDRRVVDAQFGVHHFSSTVCETHQFRGSKGSLVKRDSHCRVIYDDVRRRSTILVGDWLRRHFTSSFPGAIWFRWCSTFNKMSLLQHHDAGSRTFPQRTLY